MEKEKLLKTKKEKILKAEYGSAKTPLVLGNVKIPCYVLEDGTSVISTRGIQASLGFGNYKASGDKLKNFIKNNEYATGLQKRIIGELENPIKFLRPSSGGAVPETYGYKASLLIDICNFFLELRKNKNLKEEYFTNADFAELIVTSAAKVGIDALIHEVTGYQYGRRRDELRKLLEKYVQEEARQWVKEFPDEFFKEMDRLYENPPTISRKRPLYYGNFIKIHVYKPLEHGLVLERLEEVNPTIKTDGGKKFHKKYRHHQYTTKEIGINQVRLQVGKVLGIMQVSPSLRRFKENFERTTQLTLFED